MPYISRNETGVIVEVSDHETDSATIWVESTDPELRGYFKKGLDLQEITQNTLNESDAEMARVVEDLIDVLLSKQVFTYTELPEIVQEKLAKRRQLRKDYNALEGLIVDDEDIF